MTLRVDGFSGGCLDKHMRRHFSYAIGQSDADRLREDQSTRGIEIFAHTLGVDLQARQHFRQMVKRARGNAEEVSEGFPFGLPSPQAAFEFLRHRRKNRGHEAW